MATELEKKVQEIRAKAWAQCRKELAKRYPICKAQIMAGEWDQSAAMARVVGDFETLRKGDMYGSSL